jgi:hypothetical protein
MNTPYGKDVLRMLADACEKHGMLLFQYIIPVPIGITRMPIILNLLTNGKPIILEKRITLIITCSL